MKIGNQKVVSLTYELREGNEQGELIQKVDADRPFVYLFGVGGLLPKFEQNLEGLAAGDTFSFGMTLRSPTVNIAKMPSSTSILRFLKKTVKLMKIC